MTSGRHQEKPTGPRTEAGRTLVQRMLSSKTDDRMGPDDLQRAILAIEREAAGKDSPATPSLDVERLAKAMRDVVSTPGFYSGRARESELGRKARAIAVEYARLDEGSATPDQGKGEPRDPIDNQHPLIRAIADLPRHADEPGQDYVKRGGALVAALNYLWADQGKGEPR